VAKSTPRGSQEPRAPLEPTRWTQFKRDAKLQQKRGKDTRKLREIIRLLCNHLPLPEKHRDHALDGPWKGFRDCHVEPDWVLIYQKRSRELVLARTGTHSELFGK
jgi:mRNA interferase YafQ